jgi:hypothetical protein
MLQVEIPMQLSIQANLPTLVPSKAPPLSWDSYCKPETEAEGNV